MKTLRDWVAGRLVRGSRIALAAVTWASGSTARGTDALMAMDESGAMTGTVGGGFAEGQTIAAMRELLATATPLVDTSGAALSGTLTSARSATSATSQDLHFDLSPEANLSQMTCGGLLTIHLERIEPDSEAAHALLACFARVDTGASTGIAFFDGPKDTVSKPAPAHGAPIRLAAVFDEDYSITNAELNPTQSLLSALHESKPGFDGAAMFEFQQPQAADSSNAARAFWLGFSPDPTVYIFGAGHVGLATCEAATLAGFSVIVTDDRPELLTAERFPRARSLRRIENFASPLAAGPHCNAIAPGPQDCALILTRKPDIDREMLASLLTTRAGYIGLIGSKTKRAGIFASLKEQGFSDEDLARVHAPIGLAIGARTPEEISISILAEIIAVRAGVLPATRSPDSSAKTAPPAVAP